MRVSPFGRVLLIVVDVLNQEATLRLGLVLWRCRDCNPVLYMADVVLFALPCPRPPSYSSELILYSARGELVTPTGAALVRVLSSEFGRPPLFVPQAIGEKPMCRYLRKWPSTGKSVRYCGY